MYFEILAGIKDKESKHMLIMSESYGKHEMTHYSNREDS